MAKEVQKNGEVGGNDKPVEEEKWLFHYTRLDRLEQIAENCSFRLSLFEKMNDPREFGEPRSWTIPKDEHFHKEVLKTRRLCYLGCFSLDENVSTRTVKRGYAITPMWAHYGDNHSGVCIAFNKEKLLGKIQEKFPEDKHLNFKKINYNHDQARKLNTNDAFENGEKTPLEYVQEYIWYTKDIDWTYEKEFRITIPISSGIDSKSYINIPIDGCIDAIFCGSKIDLNLSNKKRIYKSAEKLGINEIKTISWDGYECFTLPLGTRFPMDHKIIASILDKTGLNIFEFSKKIKTPIEEVEAWKDGRKSIPGATKILMSMLSNNPEMIDDEGYFYIND